ncbi:MAG: DUF4093 domain-containing protein [Clostridia bacterium]
MDEKISCNCIIVCEGKYDKIKLSSIFNDEIFCTNGFGIYKDNKLLALLKKISQTKRIAIVCDSDASGFKIRNHLKKCLATNNIINVYIPDIIGKEKRKNTPSKEGKLGVEGVSKKIIIKAFENAGLLQNEETQKDRQLITKLDFYYDGLSGKNDSALKRELLKKQLSLPEHLSQNALLDVLNLLISKEEYKILIKTIAQKIEK